MKNYRMMRMSMRIRIRIRIRMVTRKKKSNRNDKKLRNLVIILTTYFLTLITFKEKKFFSNSNQNHFLFDMIDYNVIKLAFQRKPTVTKKLDRAYHLGLKELWNQVRIKNISKEKRNK